MMTTNQMLVQCHLPRDGVDQQFCSGWLCILWLMYSEAVGIREADLLLLLQSTTANGIRMAAAFF